MNSKLEGLPNAPTSPIAVVRRFNNAWTHMDLELILSLLSGDIHYHNIPLDPIIGKQAVSDYLTNAFTFDECEWVLSNISADRETVLTERVDKFRFGSTWVTLPVMGTFIVQDGLIKIWRDYFDLTDYRAQLARIK